MPNQPFTPSTPTSGPAPDAAPANRHPDNVNVTLLPGKTAVVHRVKYGSEKPGPDDKPIVLNVHKDTAAQLIKDGVAK